MNPSAMAWSICAAEPASGMKGGIRPDEGAGASTIGDIVWTARAVGGAAVAAGSSNEGAKYLAVTFRASGGASQVVVIVMFRRAGAMGHASAANSNCPSTRFTTSARAGGPSRLPNTA